LSFSDIKTGQSWQNEALRAAQAELEKSQSRYFDLYDLAPVGYCTLSEQGLILEANLTAATLLGMTRSALIRQPISRFILKEDQEIYYLHRKILFALRRASPRNTNCGWSNRTAHASGRI
jgi:PAS domain-containing protein